MIPISELYIVKKVLFAIIWLDKTIPNLPDLNFTNLPDHMSSKTQTPTYYPMHLFHKKIQNYRGAF